MVFGSIVWHSQVFGSIVWHSQVAFLDDSNSSFILLFYVKFHFAMPCIFHEREKKIGIMHVLITSNVVPISEFVDT
jgi:hypothetical protein